MWHLRESIPLAQAEEGLNIKHDIALPVSRIPGFVQSTDAALQTAFPGVRLVNFGHLGDGNLHYNVQAPAGTDAALQTAFPGVRLVNFGHLGDGNLHYNVQAPEGTDAAQFLKEREAAVNRLVYDAVSAHDGSISAEHGIGELKRDELARRKSPVALSMMRAIKAALDPQNLMNPERLL